MPDQSDQQPQEAAVSENTAVQQDSGVVLSTPAQIEMFGLLQLAHALALEIKTGMKVSSRGSVLAAAQARGLTTKRTKRGALRDVVAAIQSKNPNYEASSSIRHALDSK